mgnify:FL=1
MQEKTNLFDVVSFIYDLDIRVSFEMKCIYSSFVPLYINNQFPVSVSLIDSDSTLTINPQENYPFEVFFPLTELIIVATAIWADKTNNKNIITELNNKYDLNSFKLFKFYESQKQKQTNTEDSLIHSL